MFDSKDYQTKIAAQIRSELRAAGKNMLIGAVGLITEAEQARDIVDIEEDDRSIGEEAEAAKSMTETSGGKQPMADAILVARQFMREPEWVLKVSPLLFRFDRAWECEEEVLIVCRLRGNLASMSPGRASSIG